MKKLIGLVCGALILSLPALSDPLVISAYGRGVTEISAILSAKRQAATDAQSAGFMPSEGYRISGTRVVGVTRTGATYIARVDADLVKDLESKRIVFIVSADEAQAPRLLALVQRVRNSLVEQRSGKQPHIEVVDALATGMLRISNLADLQLPGVDAELDQMVRLQRADALYLISGSIDARLIFLVSTQKDGGTSKTIRTLRDSPGGNALSLTAQVAQALRQDVDRLVDASDMHSVVMLQTAGISVRKGQSVIIYADKSYEGGVRESSIVTHGIVTEIFGSKVRVLTEQPVPTALGSKLRLSPLPKRGIVITESDW